MSDPSTIDFFVGTYTDGDSQGIYQCSINQNGELSEITLLVKAENPSFLAKSEDGQYLLAVNEVSNSDDVGYVSSYIIKGDSLIFINKKSSGGAHPCHIAANKDNYVVVANYSSGNVGLLQLEADGQLSDLLDIQQHKGNGSHSRQEAAHAHSAWFTEEGGLISVDLGTNQLWFSSIDPELRTFLPDEPATFDMEDGAGPRHLVFHPDQPWIYVVNELTSSVSLLKEDSETGNYSIFQTISTLPGEYTDANTCADIRISSDGKFLYASNRGHNSIALFEVDSNNGKLQTIGHELTRGETPRNFSLSPDGTFLLVANQTSNSIVSFKRDITSGLLTYVSEIEAPAPVCILF